MSRIFRSIRSTGIIWVGVVDFDNGFLAGMQVPSQWIRWILEITSCDLREIGAITSLHLKQHCGPRGIASSLRPSFGGTEFLAITMGCRE
jgi:hypothetical protein